MPSLTSHLLGQAVGHHLQEEVAAPEDVVVLAGHLLGGLHAPAGDGLGDLAAQAGRAGHQPLGVLAQQLLVDAGAVIEALQEAHRVEVGQVLPAGVVLGQQDQVVAAPLGLVVAIGGDVGLAAEDGLDPVLLGLLVEVDRPEQVAVVGHGHALHPQLQGLGEQIVHPDGAVEQAVLGVQMQMRELGHRRQTFYAPGWGDSRPVPVPVVLSIFRATWDDPNVGP